MGVDFSVNDRHVAQWAYSGFHSFRKKLAKEIGIELDKMEGFGERPPSVLDKLPNFCDVASGKAEMPPQEEIIQKMQQYERQYIESRGTISWDTIDDPIVPLLHHSDCDGILAPEECAQVAPRLAELIKDWPDTITFDTEPAHQAMGYPRQMTIPDHDTVNARGLMDGMWEAVKTNSPLEFH